MAGQTIKGDLVIEGTRKTWNTQLRQTYAYNIFSVSGTFNSIACTAATFWTLSQRYDFGVFVTTNNVNNVVVVNWEIPKDYVNGRSIKVELHYTYTDASWWNIRRGIGLQRMNAANAFTWDTGAIVYDESTKAAAIQATYLANEHAITFSGAGRVAGDKFAIIVYRNTTTANPDTLGSSVYLNTISMYTI